MAGDNSLIQAKLDFLRSPQAYPDSPAQIEMIETHMSWVFLTDRFAYKLKKPVRYEYLDFSTVAARHFYCQEELRLNSWLAPRIYLAVIPLVRTGEGALRLEAAGDKVLDWLVKMQRLPRENMFDSLYFQRRLGQDHLQRLVEVLTGFYRELKPEIVNGEDYLRRCRANVSVNLRHFESDAKDWAGVDPRGLCRIQLDFIKAQSDLFRRRALGGNVIEGHGDLRPCHVCFTAQKPVIFDRLEFNRDFRILDRVDDIACLLMECDFIGAEEPAKQFWRLFQKTSGDECPPDLLHFYLAYRATLRARLALARIQEARDRSETKWQERAQRYLTLARRYSQRL